jgi:acetyl-CoA carboxylase beta subunit
VTTLSAAALLDSLIDEGTWRSWDRPPRSSGDGDAYQAQRDRAAQRSGTDESIVTGRAVIDGSPVALVVGEFGYLAGSIGHDAADRIVAAYDRARAEALPLVAATASGGTRMQEGTPAFLRMAGIAAAAAEHRRVGLRSIVLLRSPTTGGVLATWGSLGQVSVADPGALVGFLGPRVYEEVTGQPFPPGVQVAEHLVASGVVDHVAPTAMWREEVVRYLRATEPGNGAAPAVASLRADAPPHPDPDAWARVLATRSADRPGAADLLRSCGADVWELSGSGSGDPAAGLLLGPARIGDRGVVVIAQDRQRQAAGASIGPWSLRAARRAVALAGELDLPIVTIVDTPGAELSAAAEEGAMAGEIARCLADLMLAEVPTVSVLLGQGTGGGAIALLPADRVIAAENGWVTPLPPEGAAAILYRDAGRAPDMAAQQRITAAALAGAGAVDGVVPEQGDWLGVVAEQLASALGALQEQPVAVRREARRRRWRALERG